MDKRFLDTVSKALNTAPEYLNANTAPGCLPVWDSLNHWVLVAALEEAYEIEFTMEEVAGFKNLGNIYSLINSKLI